MNEKFQCPGCMKRYPEPQQTLCAACVRRHTEVSHRLEGHSKPIVGCFLCKGDKVYA